MFTSLLVGLDGSQQADVALAQATLIGEHFHSKIVLVHVARVESLAGRRSTWNRSGSDSGSSAALDPATREMLERAADSVRQAGLSVVVEIRPGDVVETLRELAAEAGVLLVGRSGVLGAGDPLGPDTRELIRRCPVPVLVCGSRTSPMDRCLVAYDGQASSEAALAFAARYAEIAGAHLDVLHVADNPADGEAVLARTSAAFSASPFHYEMHLASGSVEQAVAAAVERLKSNALFTGIGRDEGRRLVPSHTEAILRATDLPVLVHTQATDPSARLTGTHRRSSFG
jgi:nucleotide-binding universal stress UspA family protein